MGFLWTHVRVVGVVFDVVWIRVWDSNPWQRSNGVFGFAGRCLWIWPCIVDLCLVLWLWVNLCMYCDELWIMLWLSRAWVVSMAVVVFLELVMEEGGVVLFCCLSQTGCVCHCWLVSVVCWNGCLIVSVWVQVCVCLGSGPIVKMWDRNCSESKCMDYLLLWLLFLFIPMLLKERKNNEW